jgi:hypothetical protein
MGEQRLQRRLEREGRQELRHDGTGGELDDPEHLSALGRVLHWGLIATGLRERGRRNALDFRVPRNEVALATLPPAFDGFRLLHLGDLHADTGSRFAQALGAAIEGVECDACVLSGDYRFAIKGSGRPALEALEQIVPRLPAPAFAVLGNHDSFAIGEGLESLGVRVLMNERATLRRGDAHLHIAGIDDAHYFGTHDIAQAAHGLAPDDCAILLSHTPATYREAAAHGFDLMLSGHTHGGQICLPGGIPVLTDCPAPRRLASGRWREGAMHGYTTRGCGCAVIDARFHCPPEAALHVLRCAR